MKLLEAQSLAAGQKIGQIYLYEKYFPLPFDKYIVIAPWSKPSKCYDFWNDVISIIHPSLEKNNIKIVQIGGPNEIPLRNTYYIAGQTSIGQVAYLIKNSLLFVGADSFGQHIAGHYDKPLVDLISNNYANVVRPYFGNGSNQIIFEPNRKENEFPSFALQEANKAINTIIPEEIARSICKLLNIENHFPYEQVYCGPTYLAPMVISLCDTIVNPNQFGANRMIVDMRRNFDEKILLQQLQVCPCVIVTDKIISQQILVEGKRNNRISEIIYFINEGHSVSFVEELKNMGINYKLASELSQSEIDKLKLDYFELGVITKKAIFNKDNVNELKDLDINSLFYKSSKFFISKGKIFPSLASVSLDKPSDNFDSINQAIDSPEWWDSLDSYRVFRTI